MFTRKPLSIAMAAAFGVASAGSMMSSAVFAQEAAATNDDSMIEEIVTTGSRIKRSTNTQSQEIITITAEDMQLSGDISVADALRSSTMNSLGSFRESSGSSAQSNATLNLRGLGAARTLILINGRRVVGSPSLGGGGTVNLNMIPFSAVDRVELIADGASAVYGSDAVAGVVNVILKKNYDGMKVSARWGDRSQDDGVEKSFSVLIGATGDKSSVTMGLEYDARDPIFDADRDYTAARYSDLDGDGEITGYAETVGVSYYGYTLINPTYDPSLPFDSNNEATWAYSPGANCQDGVNGYAGVMNFEAVAGPESGYYCGYAYALVSANRAGVERLNGWVSAEYELTDSIDVYADAIFAQNESFGRYAPPAAPGPTIPGDPRNNVGATFGYFRWTDIGTRDNVVNDTFTDINIGAKGDITDEISWEAGYTYSNYVSSSVGNYYLNYAGIEYNINYDIQDFDTFVANIKHTTLNDDRQSMNKMFGGMQFDMFEMDGGTASAYAGVEYYKMGYTALVDAQSEAGLVGGSAGNSAAGNRDVTAFAAEAVFPITDWLEVDAAIRYDDYSDFGSATSPRVGATMAIPGYEAIRVKASYGQGFRAPDLSSLYGATAFSAETATDYWLCEQQGIDPCPSRQFDTYIGSNPNLNAETSETWSLGVDYTFLDNWTASINYFSLDLSDAINYVSAQDQLNVDYANGGTSAAVTRDTNGGVQEISAGYDNGTTDLNRAAVDFMLRGGFDTDYGNFGVALNSTMYQNYDVEETYGTGETFDAVGTLGFPEWRSNLYLDWTMGDFFVTFNYDYIGESKSRLGSEKWKAWDVMNASVGYNWADYGTFTLGANNLTDEDPLLDNLGQPEDEYQYDQTGRVVFIRYTKEF
jgi:iron complex outermembrane receptor protein